jgi:purine-binding chemotaxis protein CheW
VEHVVETMRPLPVAPLGDAPPFVRGLAIVRGAPVIVVDAARLLGVASDAATRYVIVRAGGDRRIALAVDAVLDVRPFVGTELAALPALVRADAIAQIGAADHGLVVVLEAARAVPDDVWARAEATP